MKTLHLHIERLIVDGLPDREQRRFVQLLQTRLHELAQGGLAEGFEKSSRRHIAALELGALRPGSSAAQAATQVTAALRKCLAGHGAGGAAPSARKGPGHV